MLWILTLSLCKRKERQEKSRKRGRKTLERDLGHLLSVAIPMKKPPDPHLPLFNEALPTPKTSFNGAVPSTSHPSTLSAVIIAERWFQPQAFHTQFEFFPKSTLSLRLKDEICLNVPQSRTDLSVSLPLNGGNDSHHLFQLLVFHQIDDCLPKLPFPLRISYSLQAVYL